MLAGLYVVYVIVLAKLKPHLMPPLSAEQRFVPLPPATEVVSRGVSNSALPALLRALGRTDLGVARAHLWRQLGVVVLPLLVVSAAAAYSWHLNTRPVVAESASAALESLGASRSAEPEAAAGSLQEPPKAEDNSLREPPKEEDSGLKEPPKEQEGDLKEPPKDGEGVKEPPGAQAVQEPKTAAEPGVAEPPAAAGAAAAAEPAERTPATRGWWIGLGASALALVAFYALLSFQRLEIFKMLLQSFFPLVVLILAVLGSIVFGLTTPTEAAAVGAFGGYLLAAVYATIAKRRDKARVFAVWLLLWAPALVAIAWFALHKSDVVAAPVSVAFGTLAALGVAVWALLAYRQAGLQTEVKESVFLTAKTSAMVCWLFVGSAIFSAAFALLGGQELVERWVMSMNLTKTEFLILSQVIIFILGWPLEWTEIIVIFMPIFIPLLDNFGVDPLFFGLLVALNLQTAFLSPPVAMAAFYLKGVSPPHVTLNQIFAGMLPFMGIQVIAIVLLYNFPAIGLWLPQVLYK